MAARHLRSGLPLLQAHLAATESAVVSQASRGLSSQAAKPAGKKIKSYANGGSLNQFTQQIIECRCIFMVPEALYGGTGNYASALFLSAAKANSLDKVESEIRDVVGASRKSPMFSQFMKDPSVPKETRVKAITEIFSEAGFSDITKNFLAVLASNGRLKYVERIAERFVDLTMAHKGEVKVVVRTVIPLPEKEEKELKETLQDILGKDKTILVEQKIDYSIMGGLVIEFGQKVFDMSIKTRAKQMESFLRQPVDI
uniref:ATP synthase n=1 Tax=Brachypodium distachyon TaxID=15368 RepID=C3SA67_BRADI|nr:ATP synthase [Brachypodium distachyon]